jgi:hypothetical protein
MVKAVGRKRGGWLAEAAERIQKGIADKFAELINESTHFCSPNLELKQVTLTDSSVLV